MNHPYKAIIFDFFGVFAASMATEWFKKVVHSDPEMLVAFQALCTKSDYGKLSRHDFMVEASKLSGVPAEQVALGIEAETKINDSLVAYSRELKAAGYRLACLSNGTHEWTTRVIDDYGLGDLFELTVLSADLGIVKPDHRIYVYTLEKLNLSAKDVVFVDDRQSNVDAAEACGMRSLLFTDTDTFIKDFHQLVRAEQRFSR